LNEKNLNTLVISNRELEILKTYGFNNVYTIDEYNLIKNQPEIKNIIMIDTTIYLDDFDNYFNSIIEIVQKNININVYVCNNNIHNYNKLIQNDIYNTSFLNFIKFLLEKELNVCVFGKPNIETYDLSKNILSKINGENEITKIFVVGTNEDYLISQKESNYNLYNSVLIRNKQSNTLQNGIDIEFNDLKDFLLNLIFSEPNLEDNER
jgi:ribonucleotide monophosphatase NagD (HAD superfamily)